VSVCWFIAEPVIGTLPDVEPDSNDDNGECHQMVMSWTIQDWRVNVFCKLLFVTELLNDDDVNGRSRLLSVLNALHDFCCLTSYSGCFGILLNYNVATFIEK